jgi:hypothetical protein
MKIKELITSLNIDVVKLSKSLKRDIDNLEYEFEGIERYKSQKYITDSMHKITSIIMQIKKLEKLDDSSEEISDLDKKIIEEFIMKKAAENKKKHGN